MKTAQEFAEEATNSCMDASYYQDAVEQMKIMIAARDEEIHDFYEEALAEAANDLREQTDTAVELAKQLETVKRECVDRAGRWFESIHSNSELPDNHAFARLRIRQYMGLVDAILGTADNARGE